MDPTDRADLAYQIATVSRRWRRLLDERLRNTGLTQARWQILVELARAGGEISQRELADRLGVEPASVVAQLDGLEAQDLVCRRSDPADRRINLVGLTPAAGPVTETITRIVAAFRAEAMAGLTDDEVAAAGAVLRKIRSNLEQG